MAHRVETNYGNHGTYRPWKMADMMTMLSKLTLLKEGGGVWVRNFEKTEELACTLYISDEKPSSHSRMAWWSAVRTEYPVDPNSQTLKNRVQRRGQCEKVHETGSGKYRK